MEDTEHYFLDPVTAGKRQMARQNMRDRIADAYLCLLTKNETVTVDKIIRKANISRATYFRYFSSRDDIVVYKLIRMWENYASLHQVKSPDTFDPENAYSFFEYVYCNRDVRRMLISTSKLNVSYEAFARVYCVRSRADYHSIFYGIGLWAVVDAWERRGYQESIEDMVRIIQDASIR